MTLGPQTGLSGDAATEAHAAFRDQFASSAERIAALLEEFEK